MTHYFGLSHVLATDYYVLKKLLYFLYKNNLADEKKFTFL